MIGSRGFGPAAPAQSGPDPVPLPGMSIPGAGIIAEAIGPYAVSGGWWRKPVERRYWYVRIGRETPATPRAGGEAGASGAWIWIYHDGVRRRWFRQAEVD